MLQTVTIIVPFVAKVHFVGDKTSKISIVYSLHSKSRHVLRHVKGRTLLSATATCSGWVAYVFRASSVSKELSSITSALELSSLLSITTLISISPGICPLRFSSPFLMFSLTSLSCSAGISSRSFQSIMCLTI